MSTTIINGVLILSGDLTCDENIQVNGKIIPIPDEDYKKTFYSYQSNSYITANGKGNTIISTIGDIIVTGEIDGFGCGFESENGPGNNSLLEDSSGNTLTGYGSTHAGIGYIDNILAPSPKIPYGNHETPVSLGSGAGYYHDPVIFFGEETKGGGAIKLEAPSGTVRVNGTINMNGMDGTHVGGASGGSIWIDAWNIDGTGYMYSEGGSTLLASNAGGGGGGYISLWYEQNNTFTGILSVSGKSEGYDGKKYTKQIIPILEDRFTGTILNTKWWDASNSITLNNNLNLISINGDFNDPVVNSKFTISGKNITTNIDLIPKGLESTSYTAEFLLYSDTRNWVGVARKNSGIYGISSVDGFVSSTGIPFDYTNITFRIIKEDSTFIYQYYDNTSTPQTLYTDIIPDLAYNTFKVKLRLNKPDPTLFISEYRRLSTYDISNQYIELDAPPLDTSAVALNLTYGTSQYLNTDFYISGRKLSWDSTGCSGILISLLEVGDTLRVMYPWDYTSYNGMEILFDNFKVTEGIIGNAETTEPIIYVDSDYGSDSSEGLQLSPLKNLFVATAWAKRGGTIILYDGTYNSTSIIGKDITIRGANGVKPLVTTDYVKDTTGSGWEETAISLYGCQGLIENIKINNSVYGIKVENGNFDLINNEIYDSIYGISFLNCDPLVARNKIYRCTERGLDFTSCIPPKIYSNVIHDSSVALYAGNTPDMTVSFNTFDNNQSHIVLDCSSATVISSNNLTYSVVGIQASPDSPFGSYNNNFYNSATEHSRIPDSSANNFSDNPLYYDRLGGDYHISVGSPDINAGIMIYDDYLIDYDGADRTHSDVGAFQYIHTDNTGDYYVSGRGNDYWNNGSISEPFRTLDKAMIVADSTIHIDGGHYDSYYLQLRSQNVDLNQLYIYMGEPNNCFLTYITLDSTAIHNGYITLPTFVSADETSNVAMNIVGGASQILSVDYEIQYGSLTWKGYALDNFLAVGDILRILFWGTLQLKALNTFILHSHYSNLEKEKAIYVSPNGSDSTVLGGDGTNTGGIGTLILPYRTISKALEQSNVGDNIVAFAGEYPLFNGLDNRILVPVSDMTTVLNGKRYYEDYFAPVDFRIYGTTEYDYVPWLFTYSGNSNVFSGGGFLNFTFDGTNIPKAVSEFNLMGDFEVSVDLRNAIDPIKLMATSSDTTAYFNYNNLQYISGVITGGENYICRGTLIGDYDNTSSEQFITEYIVVNSNDIRNKYVSLSYIPESDCTNVAVNIIGGVPQNLGEDFYLEDSKIKWDGMALDGELEAGEILRVMYIDRSLSDSIRALISLKDNRFTIKAFDNTWKVIQKRDIVGNYNNPWKVTILMDSTGVGFNHSCIYGKGFASKFLAVADFFTNTELDKPLGYNTEKNNIVIYKDRF